MAVDDIFPHFPHRELRDHGSAQPLLELARFRFLLNPIRKSSGPFSFESSDSCSETGHREIREVHRRVRIPHHPQLRKCDLVRQRQCQMKCPKKYQFHFEPNLPMRSRKWEKENSRFFGFAIFRDSQNASPVDSCRCWESQPIFRSRNPY